jgi:hypothetical protein
MRLRRINKYCRTICNCPQLFVDRFFSVLKHCHRIKVFNGIDESDGRDLVRKIRRTKRSKIINDENFSLYYDVYFYE